MNGVVGQTVRTVVVMAALGCGAAIGACAHTSFAPAAAVASRPSIAPGDWPTFNRTLAGDRFSPLAEIDRSNVARLAAVCRYRLPEVTALQTGPVVISGTM